MELPLFWDSETHHGTIRRTSGATADGSVVDLGFWASATEKKTGFKEHVLPYTSIEAAMKCLTAKYPQFKVTGEDAVAEFMTEE
jgi:hypothetical protein